MPIVEPAVVQRVPMVMYKSNISVSCLKRGDYQIFFDFLIIIERPTCVASEGKIVVANYIL